jgi:hypothetical protein
MPKASAKMMHHSQALYVFSVYVGACHTFFIASAPPRGCGVGWGGVGWAVKIGQETGRIGILVALARCGRERQDAR